MSEKRKQEETKRNKLTCAVCNHDYDPEYDSRNNPWTCACKQMTITKHMLLGLDHFDVQGITKYVWLTDQSSLTSAEIETIQKLQAEHCKEPDTSDEEKNGFSFFD